MGKNDQAVAYAKDFLKGGEFDNKLLPVMAYLKFRYDIVGRAGFTLNHMVETIGYTPDYHRGRINDKITEQLKWLQNGNYVSFDVDLDGIKPKDFIVAQINRENNIFDMNIADSGTTKPFVLLTENEFDIISQSDTRSDKAALIRVFLSIKKHISMSVRVGSPKTSPQRSKVRLVVMIMKPLSLREESRLNKSSLPDLSKEI